MTNRPQFDIDLVMLDRDSVVLAGDVIDRLEEAGATLLAMGGRQAGPGHSVTWWPDMVRTSFIDLPSGGTLRPAIPDASAISRMDEALGWIGLIPQANYVLRRIVGARSLVSPLTGKHLFTWRRIADALGAEPRAVRVWHAKGIALICNALRMRDAA